MATRSGFVEGRCPDCGVMRFSKGQTHKHKCKGGKNNDSKDSS